MELIVYDLFTLSSVRFCHGDVIVNRHCVHCVVGAFVYAALVQLHGFTRFTESGQSHGPL